eukprot:7098012-Prymnesium_polylepis.1
MRAAEVAALGGGDGSARRWGAISGASRARDGSARAMLADLSHESDAAAAALDLQPRKLAGLRPHHVRDRLSPRQRRDAAAAADDATAAADPAATDATDATAAGLATADRR